jgi:hypothetical protein
MILGTQRKGWCCCVSDSMDNLRPLILCSVPFRPPTLHSAIPPKLLDDLLDIHISRSVGAGSEIVDPACSGTSVSIQPLFARYPAPMNPLRCTFASPMLCDITPRIMSC